MELLATIFLLSYALINAVLAWMVFGKGYLITARGIGLTALARFFCVIGLTIIHADAWFVGLIAVLWVFDAYVDSKRIGKPDYTKVSQAFMMSLFWVVFAGVVVTTYL